MPMYYVANFSVDPDYGTTITQNFTWTLTMNETCWNKDSKYEVQAYTSSVTRFEIAGERHMM